MSVTPGRPPLPQGFERQLKEFDVCLRVEAGLAHATLGSYRADLERFFRWLGTRDVTRWEDVDAALVVDFLAWRRGQGLAEATLARNLVAVRMFARFLPEEGHASHDPAALIAAPVLRRILPHTLAVEDVERLLAAPALLARGRTDSWRTQRDQALLEVLYACGARVSEAVGLRTDALEPSLRVLRLLGKGSRMRIVPMGERARAALELWLADGRQTLPGADRRPEVFLTRRGNPLDRVNAWRRVKAAALAAGLPPDVSPHTLRHSFATHLIEGGADLRSVQEMLGHASIRTTEVYTHVNAEHLRSLHRLYHPRG